MESFLSIYSEEISTLPEKFIVLVDGIPPATKSERVKTWEYDVPKFLLNIDGLEMQSIKSGPLQNVFSDAREISAAMSDKDMRKGYLPELTAMLQAAVEWNIIDFKEKMRITAAFVFNDFHEVKVSVDKIIGKYLFHDKAIKKENNTTAAIQQKHAQLESLMEKYPDRTIIVLDSLSKMHNGIFAREKPDLTGFSFDLDSKKTLEMKVSQIMRVQPIPGWVDSLKPELRAKTFSFAMDAQKKTLAGEQSNEIAAYKSIDLDLVDGTLKLHSPSIILEALDSLGD